MACPILLMDWDLACLSSPVLSSKASSSKKKERWLPLSRKYASLVLLVLRREDGSRDGGWVEGFDELVRAAEHAGDLVG